MKTSNKLMIAFASMLILIPVLGIAIISRMYYENGDLLSTENTEMDTFSTISNNMSSIGISSPYRTLSIDGGNDFYLEVRLINDEKSGIKFDNHIKELVSAKVDGNGQLKIVLNRPDKQGGNYARVWIYGPSIKQLKMTNSNVINLNAELDSLQLDLSKIGTANFGTKTKIGWLSVHTEDVQGISFTEAATKSVNLELNGTSVKSEMSSFESLSISAAGNAEIELNGGNNEKANKVIRKLRLNTLGKAKVKISNLQIDQCSGEFSDSTQVEMPMINIKQMFNLK